MEQPTDSDVPPQCKRQRTEARAVLAPRRLGSSDMVVSGIALGCFAFGGDRKTGTHLGAAFTALHNGVWGSQDDKDTFDTVRKALDSGINFFDNAEMYGDGYAEEVLGRALKASGYGRSEYYIATKVSEAFLSAQLVREHVEASIARMDCGYIDLLQLHWASRAAVRTSRYPERPLEREVPLEETLGALEELRKEGKVRHLGACNFGPRDIERWLATGVPMTSNQICYNLLWRGIEAEVLPLCLQHNIAILPWGPMGQGLLAGKWQSADEVPPGRARSRLFSSMRPQQRHGEPGLEAEAFRAVAKMKWIASQLGAPLANVALAWLLARPGVGAVLMGARSVGQLEGNLHAAQLQLPEEVQELLADAGEDIKQKLGGNLDPYEPADATRIV